jgi:hypothetical protein
MLAHPGNPSTAATANTAPIFIFDASLVYLAGAGTKRISGTQPQPLGRPELNAAFPHAEAQVHQRLQSGS